MTILQDLLIMLLFKEFRLFVLAFNNTIQDIAGNPINNTANRVQRDSHK